MVSPRWLAKVLEVGKGLGVGVMFPYERWFVRFAASAVLVGALTLAGCGRKAGLDPPPANTLTDPLSTVLDPGPGHDTSGAPVAPPGQKKNIPVLDWLID
jgi:predicted small lipoprotein YifL